MASDQILTEFQSLSFVKVLSVYKLPRGDLAAEHVIDDFVFAIYPGGSTSEVGVSFPIATHNLIHDLELRSLPDLRPLQALNIDTGPISPNSSR